MSQAPLRIIQITDTHLHADKTKVLLGVNAEESFAAVLDLIQQKEKHIDFILHTGDIAQDGSDEAYLRIADKLSDFALPVYCVPGNHDNVEGIKRNYPRKNMSWVQSIVLPHWIIVLLNSQIPGKVGGYLDAAALAYLEQCLTTHAHLHAMVVFHHQPVPVGAKWLDKLGIGNQDDFWQVLHRHANMKTVLFGHVHQAFERQVGSIHCYATPATCFQFMRHQDHFGLENLAPGYRFVELHNDGRLDTGIVRLPHYIGVFEPDAKGY